MISNLREALGLDAFETGDDLRCRVCEEWKDSSMFHRDPTTSTGFDTRCASCVFRIRNRIIWEPRVDVCTVADCDAEAVLTYFCHEHRDRATRPARKGYRRHVWRTRLVGVTLYRVYDRSGALLYVGVTADVKARFSQHRREDSWWQLAADPSRTVLVGYPTREAAEEAKREAIRTEHPRHNVQYAPRGAREPKLLPTLDGFLPGVLVAAPGARMATTLVFDLFREHADNPDLADVSARALYRALEARGHGRKKSGGKWFVEGVRRARPEPPTDARGLDDVL